MNAEPAHELVQERGGGQRKKIKKNRWGMECLICTPCMYALYVCLTCLPYMYALYVYLVCMPPMQSMLTNLRRRAGVSAVPEYL